MATAKPDTRVQTNPGDTTAPQTDSNLEGKSAVELLALAGDENARRSLGQPTATTAPARGTGDVAAETVYEDSNGKLVHGEPSPGANGFRGSVVAVKGQVLTPAAAARLAAG